MEKTGYTQGSLKGSLSPVEALEITAVGFISERSREA
jgi:hypothetical protein